MSMYVLKVNVSFLGLFGGFDNVHFKINRDEKFLKEVVPKIEDFYYKYFIPVLPQFTK